MSVIVDQVKFTKNEAFRTSSGTKAFRTSSGTFAHYKKNKLPKECHNKCREAVPGCGF